MACTGASEVRIFDEQPSIWDYAEVTAARLDAMPDGTKTLEMTMWKEDAGIAVRCAEVAVTPSK